MPAYFTKIKQIGSSLGVIIDKKFAKNFGWKEGDVVKIIKVEEHASE